MKAVIESATGKAIYLLQDAETAVIDGTGLHGVVRAFDIKPETHEIVTVPAPEIWVGGALSWSGTDWVVLDQPALDAEAERLEGLKRDAVNVERDRRIATGATFTVTGYGDIPITGAQRDQSMLTGLLIKAQGAKALGVTASVMKLRDAVNGNHLLTPDQMLELISLGMSWIEDTMQVSWDMKDAEGDFTAGIPDDFRDDSYWP